MIEWGCTYQHVRMGVPGRERQAPAPSREAAARTVQDLLAEDPGTWTGVGLIWRVKAVPAGKWEPFRATGAVLPDESSPQVVSDVLSLACATVIPPEVTALWTVAERAAATEWAAAQCLPAGDGQDVRRVLKPRLVERAEEVCGSPAQAQLAVEAWASRPSEADFMRGSSSLAALARDALTGLTVLLAERAAR
jgi:hypothetical protein